MKKKTRFNNIGIHLLQRIMILFIILTVATFYNPLCAQKKKDSNRDARCAYSKDLMQPFYKEIKTGIQNLKQQGKLKFPESGRKKKTLASSSKAALDPYVLKWPLVNAKYRDFPSWHINNFVDHNDASIVDDEDGDGDDDNLRNPAEITDYNCGDRTYDGHNGIDIGVDPYSWEIKANGSVQVVAAHAGVIVEKHQGEFDENCGSLGADPVCHNSPANRGNYIVMLLDDSSTAIFYMHMKDGSLTGKDVGDYVDKGEYLGTVASAGCSTGPHLHFEIHLFYDDEDNTGSRIESFQNGSCAWDYSWAAVWENEPPYNDPAVLTLETHYSNPENSYTSSCDKTIDLFYKNSFSSNQTVWLRSMFRDWVDGIPVTHKVYSPFGGDPVLSYNASNPNKYRSFIPPDHSFTPAANLVGTWRYTVTFGGKTYDHYFALTCLPTYTLSGAVSSHKGYMCSDHITSTQTISSSSANYIKYMADGHVTLSPGFRATAGCRFVANTEGCNNSASKSSKLAETVTNAVTKQPAVANDKTPGLSVFPNPSTGMFTVQYSGKETFIASVNIRNTMGQVVYSIPAKTYYNRLQEKVNISGKPKGMYLVEIAAGDKSITTKILIQ